MTIWDVFGKWSGAVEGTCEACAIKPPDKRRLHINLTSGREQVEEFVYRFDEVVVDVDGEEHTFSAEAFVAALEEVAGALGDGADEPDTARRDVDARGGDGR